MMVLFCRIGWTIGCEEGVEEIGFVGVVGLEIVGLDVAALDAAALDVVVHVVVLDAVVLATRVRF